MIEGSYLFSLGRSLSHRSKNNLVTGQPLSLENKSKTLVETTAKNTRYTCCYVSNKHKIVVPSHYESHHRYSSPIPTRFARNNNNNNNIPSYHVVAVLLLRSASDPRRWIDHRHGTISRQGGVRDQRGLHVRCHASRVRSMRETRAAVGEGQIGDSGLPQSRIRSPRVRYG